jgi:thioredoxin reductase (NADPH)
VDPATGIPVHDRRTMQTDAPGVYIAGVVAAGLNPNKIFIENGKFHGPLIVDSVLGREPDPAVLASAAALPSAT